MSFLIVQILHTINQFSCPALNTFTKQLPYYSEDSILGSNIQGNNNNNNNNNNIRLLKIDKPQLNTEMIKVKVIHT